MVRHTRRRLEAVGALVLGVWLTTPAAALAASPTPLGPLAPPTLDGPGTVRVRVLSAREGHPVPGAVAAILRDLHVQGASETATADANGLATFPEAPAGVFTVCARGEGHAEACEGLVGLVRGGRLDVTLRLPRGATLTGKVLDAEGRPVVGAQVEADEDLVTRLPPATSLTDEHGHYRFTGLKPGAVDLRLSTLEGRARRRSVEDLRAGEQKRFDMRLAPFVSVAVRPVLRPGRWKGPVESVSLASIHLEPRPDGSWTGRAEAGEYDLYINGPDQELRQQLHQRVTLAAGGRPQVLKPALVASRPAVVPLVRGSRPESPSEPFTLAGHVLLPDGSPAPGAIVAYEKPLSGPCGNEPRAYERVRFEGSGFALPLRARGTLRVYAWLEDGRAGHIQVSGKPGERAVALIPLEETGAVVGRFPPPQNPDDGPLDVVVDDRWMGAWQFTAMDRSFFVAGLAPGTHTLNLSEREVTFEVKARERTDLGLLKP